MLCEGGGGRRPLLRRCLQSPCSALGQCFQAGGLIGLEPPLLVFVRGSRWHKCIPPTLGWEDCIHCISGFKWWLWLQLQYLSIAVSGTVGHQDLLGGPVYLWIVMR